MALKASGNCVKALSDEIQAIVDPAAECFNQLLAANNVEQAARYADALAALFPNNAAVLSSALSCNTTLGRTDQAKKLARALIDLQPSHQGARDALGSQATNVEPAVSPAHPLIQLRDLYDQASTILCGTLTDRSEEEIHQLIAAARKLDVTVPQDLEWAIWEKHYRLALQAIEMSATTEPMPRKASETEVFFASATGKALSWRAVQAAAKALRAKAVFFAAADMAYVDLYGRAYIELILEHCDVSSLIVVHIIGGAKELQRTAKSIGITSNRRFSQAMHLMPQV